jgi:hypothetical protein
MLPVMRRWAGRALTVLSLLLCLGAAILWPVSHTTTQQAYAAAGNWLLLTYSSEGKFQLMVARGWPGAVGAHAYSAPNTSTLGEFIPYFHQYHLQTDKYPLTIEHWHGTVALGLDSKGKAVGMDAFNADSKASTVPLQLQRLKMSFATATVLFALLPAGWFTVWCIRVYRRRHRHLEGHCQNCGYDLRATPDRCPECGRESSPARSAKPDSVGSAGPTG